MQITADELDRLERGWPETKIIEVDAAAVSQFPALMALRDKGFEFRWVQIARVRPLTLSGWEPAFHDPGTREIIYMNRLHNSARFRGSHELILIARNPAESLLLPIPPLKSLQP